MNMKIVNITDIEDIVLAKAEIDKNDPDCNGRSNLNEFMSKYCTLTDVLVIDNKLLSFKFVELFNNRYLFISDNNYVSEIIDLLKTANYNFNNLTEIKMTEFINDLEKYIIHENKYYKVK